MAWEALLGVVLGAVLALVGGRINRRFEVQRETQARMFERMQNVREQLGEEYRNPARSTLHDELTLIFRWSVLADRTTHARARELIALEWKRKEVLVEATNTNAYSQGELEVVARQEHEDVVQEMSQAVEMLDEHLGNRLRRLL